MESGAALAPCSSGASKQSDPEKHDDDRLPVDARRLLLADSLKRDGVPPGD
jgi:hypothetical protein